VSRRSILLVLTLLLLAVLVSAGLTVFVVMSGGAPAPIPSNATLYLKLAAPWSEVESNDVFQPIALTSAHAPVDHRSDPERQG
jgi:hypothetical protein